CQFADDSFVRDMTNMMNNMNRWEYSGDVSSMSPRAVTDDRRVYLSWCGIAFAVDAESGKLLWRTGPFRDLSTKLQNGMRNGMSFEGDVIALAPPDRLLIIRQSGAAQRQQQQPDQQQARRELVCLSTETGKPIWD